MGTFGLVAAIAQTLFAAGSTGKAAEYGHDNLKDGVLTIRGTLEANPAGAGYVRPTPYGHAAGWKVYLRSEDANGLPVRWSVNFPDASTCKTVEKLNEKAVDVTGVPSLLNGFRGFNAEPELWILSIRTVSAEPQSSGCGVQSITGYVDAVDAEFSGSISFCDWGQSNLTFDGWTASLVQYTDKGALVNWKLRLADEKVYKAVESIRGRKVHVIGIPGPATLLDERPEFDRPPRLWVWSITPAETREQVGR